MVMSIGMGMTFVPLTLLATTNVDVRGRRARVGALQHVAAGRRRARARGALDARGVADEPPRGRRSGTTRALRGGYHLAFVVGAI